jgi:hypothetical protein
VPLPTSRETAQSNSRNQREEACRGTRYDRGKKLYARPKHTPEPVFGIVKSVLVFRQFLLRGLDKVRGEWTPVTMAWNIKRIFALNTR